MRKTIIKVLIFSFILIMFIIPHNNSHANSNITVSAYTEIYNSTYVVPYNSKVTLSNTNGRTITSSNENIAKISNNSISICGVGNFTITVKDNTNETTLKFFAWNLYMKKAAYSTYTDENRSNKSNPLHGRVYLAVSETSSKKTFLINDHFFTSGGSYSGTLNGKYITNYYKASKKTSYTRYFIYNNDAGFTTSPLFTETTPTDPEPTDPEPTDPEPTDPEPTTPTSFNISKTKTFKVTHKLSNGNTINFWMYTPETSTTNMPLIMFLHGSGECGASLDSLKSKLLVIRNLANHKIGVNAIIIIPSCTNSTQGYLTNPMALVSELKGGSFKDPYGRTISVNKDKISLIGFSQGTNYALNMNQSQASTFRTVIFGSGHKVGNAKNFASCKAVLTVYGSQESTCRTNMQGVVSAINKAGGHASYKEISGANHSATQTKLFSDNTYFNWCLNNM